MTSCALHTINWTDSSPFSKFLLGALGCFFDLMSQTLSKTRRSNTAHFPSFPWVQKNRHDFSPKAPKVLQRGGAAETGQPSARAKPCVSNTDLQNISTRLCSTRPAAPIIRISKTTTPPPLRGGQRQQHFIDQFLIEPTYLSRDGSST